MLLSFFRKNEPIAFIMLALAGALLWIFSFFHHAPANNTVNMPLFEVFNSWLSGLWIAKKILGFSLVLGGASLVNYVVNNNDLFERRTYLPALFYMIFMSCSPGLLDLHALQFANIFIALAINRMVATYRKDIAFPEMFDAGIYVGIASLFYLPSIAFTLLLASGILIFRPFIWREWVIAGLGLITPYAFVLVYYYWNDSLLMFWNDILLAILSNHSLVYDLTLSAYLLILSGGSIIFLAFGEIVPALNTHKIKTGKFLLMMIWFIFFALLSLLLAPSTSIEHFAFLALPLSCYFALFYLNKRKWLQEVYLLLFVLILFIHLWSQA